MKKNKKDLKLENDVKNLLDTLSMAMKVSVVFDEIFKDPRDEDVFELGHGLSLVVDKEIKNNTSRFSHLYKDGKRISNTIFRLGGMSYGFKGKPFTQLIVCPNYPKDTWGDHCIINKNGEITLIQKKSMDSLYYWKGVIGSMGGTYYNVETGVPIVKGSAKVTSENYLFVENSYNNEYAKGVWKIEYETGKYEIFN